MKNAFMALIVLCGIGLLVGCSSDQDTKTWTITVQSADNSMGYTSGTGVYDNNATATIKATPNEGFVFKEWNDGNNANPREIIVKEDMTFTAYFRSVGDNGDTTQYVDFNRMWVIGLWIKEGSHEYWRFVADGNGKTWDTDDDVTEDETQFLFTWDVSGHTLLVVFHDETGQMAVPKEYYLLSQTQDMMLLSDVYGMKKKFHRVLY